MCGPGPCTRCYFLAFQIASTSRILRLNPCALDSFFDRESAVLPRHAALEASFLREAAPGVWRRSSRPWRVSSFHFLSPSITWASQCKSLAVNMLIWQKNLRGQMAWARVNVKHHDVSRSISQRIGVILYGLQTIVTPGGVPHCGKLRSVSFLTQRTRLCK